MRDDSGDWDLAELFLCDDSICTGSLSNEYEAVIMTFGVDEYGKAIIRAIARNNEF